MSVRPYSTLFEGGYQFIGPVLGFAVAFYFRNSGVKERIFRLIRLGGRDAGGPNANGSSNNPCEFSVSISHKLMKANERDQFSDLRVEYTDTQYARSLYFEGEGRCKITKPVRWPVTEIITANHMWVRL